MIVGQRAGCTVSELKIIDNRQFVQDKAQIYSYIMIVIIIPNC